MGKQAKKVERAAPKFSMGDAVKLASTGEYLGNVRGEMSSLHGACKQNEKEYQGMGPNSGETFRYEFAEWDVKAGQWSYRVDRTRYLESALAAW